MPKGERGWAVGTYFETPYNFCEGTAVSIADHYVMVDTMCDQRLVESIKNPKRSGQMWSQQCWVVAARAIRTRAR
jgi:hypothetical protein